MNNDFLQEIKNELNNIEENDKFLVQIINHNIKNWDSFLLVACKLTKQNYSKKIYEILKDSGFKFENEVKAIKKINVYLNRARNKK